MKQAISDYFVLQVALIALVALLIISVSSHYGNFFSFLFGGESKLASQGAQAQVQALAQRLNYQQTLLTQTQEDRVNTTLPLYLADDMMLAFFAENEDSLPDPCTAPHSAFNIRGCEDQEVLKRDAISCGSKPCVCIYKQDSWIGKSSCVDSYLLVRCEKLDMPITLNGAHMHYGSCLSTSTPVSTLTTTVTVFRSNGEYAAIIEPSRNI